MTSKDRAAVLRSSGLDQHVFCPRAPNTNGFLGGVSASREECRTVHEPVESVNVRVLEVWRELTTDGA
jgi:hypothetical protein